MDVILPGVMLRLLAVCENGVKGSAQWDSQTVCHSVLVAAPSVEC